MLLGKESETKRPLTEFKIKDVMEKKMNKINVVAIHPDATIKEALTMMAKNNILSLPVISRAFPNKFTSIISLFDILSYIVKKYHEDVNQLTHQLDLSESVESTMTLDVEEESYRIWEVDYMDNLKDTLNVFSSGVHRALITDALHPTTSFIMTQTDIVKFIHSHINQIVFPFDSKSTIEKLCLVAPGPHGPKSLVMIHDHELAFQGYAKMKQHHILALPVVNEQGELLATLSNSHLRGLTTENFEDLKLPVKQFLNKMVLKRNNGTMRGDDNQQVQIKPVVATAQTTFEELLEKLVSHHLHRIWIVDERNFHPIGVVTLSDIISKLTL